MAVLISSRVRQRVALGERVSTQHPLVCRIPQEEILYPVFNILMCPLALLLRSLGLECHHYPNNIQLHPLMDSQSDGQVSGGCGGMAKTKLSKVEPIKVGGPVGRPTLYWGIQLPILEGVQLISLSFVKSFCVTLDACLPSEA